MKEKFAALFNSVAESSQLMREQLTKPMNIPYLSSFTAVEGKHYDKREREEVRFMLVGRAVNGWTEKRNIGEELTLEEFVRSSLANIETKSSTVSCEGNDRFEWIGDTDEYGCAPHNKYREGIDVSELAIITEPYTLSRPIWNYPMHIWCGLTGNKIQDAWKKRWFENIVWSNLYKIAPSLQGNPSDALKKAQFDACADLLLAEINLFKPSHILLLTGYDGWFDVFDKKYGNVCKLVPNYGDKKSYVEAIGEIAGAKFVVTKRPEMKAKEEFVNAVLRAFNEQEYLLD